MSYNKKILIHNPKSFTREVLEKRLLETGFKNISRMELFLWDMEIYLQIQKIFKDRIVLKGGAAAQFYIPIQYQRTSVDIDMICYGNKNDVDTVLKNIEKKFNGENNLFKFEPYKPKNPKTELALYTYFVKIPSVCNDKELYGKKLGIQEIKVEFFLTDKKLDFETILSPKIFAVDTNKMYQILPLNKLIGDKLTTLGPNTIGIQIERSDELVKQIYDIDNLIHYNLDEINWLEIFYYYSQSAIIEAKQRQITSDLNIIISDVLKQVNELALADIPKNETILKLINDFQALYLRKSITKNLSAWSIIASKLSLLFNCFNHKPFNADKFIETIKSDKYILFDNYYGQAKGDIIKNFKSEFLKQFEKYCPFETKVIKGKNPNRILWLLINYKNCEEINSWINNFMYSCK